jgi:hypothetical protein
MEALQFLESRKKTLPIPASVTLGSHPLTIEAAPLSPKDLILKRRPLSPFAKRWQFLTVCSPDLVLGVGFVHLGYITQFPPSTSSPGAPRKTGR